MDGLEDVVGAELPCPGEIGDGAGDLENAIVGAGGEVEGLHRLFEKLGTLGVDGAVLTHNLGTHIGVGADVGKFGKAGALEIAASHDALAHGGGGLALFIRGELLVVDEGDFDVEIDAVEKGAGNLGAVGYDLTGTTTALADGIAIEAAGARIEGADEEKF